MTNSKISRLLALSQAEYEAKRSSPVRQRFKARSVNLSALDEDWDRQRGAAARMMAVILREDSESLAAKVSADPAIFADAAIWLTKEAAYARKHAGRLELAAGRLGAALACIRESVESAPAESTTATA